MQVSLIFGNQTEDDIILKPELDNMARKHKNFKVPLDHARLLFVLHDVFVLCTRKST